MSAQPESTSMPASGKLEFEHEESIDEFNQEAPRTAMVNEVEQSVLRKILWYLPNRVIDLLDIVKLDIGLGSSAGLVLRASRYGQMGGRLVDPISVRLGVRGRELPFFIERSSEYGFCSTFRQTEARLVTPLEFGLGADLGVGAYVGFSFDELADFFAGFFLIDFKNDDLVPMIDPNN